jgi:activator of HSP90 ATPase
MAKLIKQSVILPASAKELYAMYVDPKKHGAIVGGEVLISAKPGSKFRAFGGALTGTMLQTVPGKLIVQAWRSTPFKKSDLDSTLILRFTPAGAGKGRIDLMHVNVPDQDYASATKGWKSYYWQPWRKYLATH